MPRRQPRRSSHASTASYTSFFGRSNRGSDSSSSSALSSSSSQSPSPPASPVVPAPAPAPAAVQRAPAPTVQPSSSGSIASSPGVKQTDPQTIADMEANLEALYQAAPGPVHSLKSIGSKEKKQLDIDMNEAGMKQNLRSWWTKRQWAYRKGTVSSKKDSKPSSASKAEVDQSQDQVKPSSAQASTSKASPSRTKPRPVVKKEKPAKSVKVAKSTPSVQSNDSPIASTSAKVRVDDSSNSPVASKAPSATIKPQISPNDSLSSPSLAKPSAFSSPTFSVKPILVQSPPQELVGGLTIVESHSSSSPGRIAAPVSQFEVPKEEPIAFPALTLLIGTWARRSAVDPTQLSFVYSSLTDSFVFSTQHLDCTYHLNLPLACITSLVLFHSLTYSRSVLLLYRDRLSPSPPHFSLTSPAHKVPIPLSQDFTPDFTASTTAIYAIELTETSSIPPIREKVESFSTSLDLDQKLFVGPWDPEVLDFEDLATSLVAQRRRVEEEDVLRFKYQGKDAIKAMEEVWARKWKTSN